ncbi:MAG: helix-turn-helix domain-containing protein, partial [Janthinobacterium lividum]
FYRLNVVPIALPPLRDRAGDIALLARHFLDRAAEQGLPRKVLDEDALATLDAHDWPGNVRELENLMRRLAVLSRDERLGAPDVAAMLGRREVGATDAATSDDPDVGAAVRARVERLTRDEPGVIEDGSLYDRIIGEVERPLIEAMLTRFNGNQLRAARALGINRNTLRKRLDRLGIDTAGRMPVPPVA